MTTLIHSSWYGIYQASNLYLVAQSCLNTNPIQWRKATDECCNTLLVFITCRMRTFTQLVLNIQWEIAAEQSLTNYILLLLFHGAWLMSPRGMGLHIAFSTTVHLLSKSSMCKCQIYYTFIALVTFLIFLLKIVFACVLVYFMGNLLTHFCEILSYLLHKREEDVSVLEEGSAEL